MYVCMYVCMHVCMYVCMLCLHVCINADVPNLFDVFQKLTFDLAKVNLKGLAAKGLGRLMGAVTWQLPAGAGDEGEPIRHMDKTQELIYYDSLSAKRTWLGYCCNADCCCTPVYKLTSV